MTIIQDILKKLPEDYNVEKMMERTERSPYAVVCLQECERMNLLLAEIQRSLTELELGLKVHLAVMVFCQHKNNN